MNIFSSLNRLFPCTPNRSSGEVVAVSIDVIRTVRGEIRTQKLFAKRKAWYVNASVNAFHMHRELIRQFSAEKHEDLSFAEETAIRRLIVLCVLNGYLAEHGLSEQYTDYCITSLATIGFARSISPAAWWICSPDDWREVVDADYPLKRIIDAAVEFVVTGRTVVVPLRK